MINRSKLTQENLIALDACQLMDDENFFYADSSEETDENCFSLDKKNWSLFDDNRTVGDTFFMNCLGKFNKGKEITRRLLQQAKS